MFSKLATAILVTIVVLSGLHVDAAPQGDGYSPKTLCIICLDPSSYNALSPLEDRLTDAC